MVAVVCYSSLLWLIVRCLLASVFVVVCYCALLLAGVYCWWLMMLLFVVVATCCHVAHVPLLVRSVLWSLMCLVVAGNSCVLRFDVCVAVCRCMCSRQLLLLLDVVA